MKQNKLCFFGFVLFCFVLFLGAISQFLRTHSYIYLLSISLYYWYGPMWMQTRQLSIHWSEKKLHFVLLNITVHHRLNSLHGGAICAGRHIGNDVKTTKTRRKYYDFTTILRPFGIRIRTRTSILHHLHILLIAIYMRIQRKTVDTTNQKIRKLSMGNENLYNLIYWKRAQ